MMDWRIGRLVRTVTRSVSLNGTISGQIAANFQRVGISFSLASEILPVFAAVGAANGSVLISSPPSALTSIDVFNRTAKFTLTDSGDLPTKAFSYFTSTYVGSLSIIEWFMPEEYLSAALNEFNSDYKI